MLKIETDSTMHMNYGERRDSVNCRYQSGGAELKDSVQ